MIGKDGLKEVISMDGLKDVISMDGLKEVIGKMESSSAANN